MPPPAPPNPDLDRFLRALERSGLHPATRIQALRRAAPADAQTDATKLGEYFADQGALTHFQITKLRQGTWQGLVLGPFHILSPLGRGGMSTVYLARDTRKPDGAKALVALKVLPPKRAREEDRMLARFRREMDMCQRVSHPNVTRTFEAGYVNGVHYIAMEYIRGMSLRRLVADHGPLSVSRAARLFAEVADGLEHAHEKGLIHRDLKPANIMVTPNGHAKVLDLGLALAVDEELPSDRKIVGDKGYVVGTMDYIAPEQVDDPTGVDARADLYALGCSLYFALTGQPPFPGGTSIEKMKRHRTAEPTEISELNPTVPSDFARVVERLMDKNPTYRYQSAAATAQALAPWTVGDPETPFDEEGGQSESDVVLEIERAHKDDQFFESIPVVVFADKRRRSNEEPSSDASVDVTERGFPLWMILVPAGILVMAVAAALTGLVLYLLKA